MKRQFPHAMLPSPVHDETSRQDFVHDFKVHVLSTLGPRRRQVFDRSAKVSFARDSGHEPRTRREINEAMTPEPTWKMWSALNRTGQELMWEGLGERAGRQRDELTTRAKSTAARKTKGSLRLNPALKIPRYNSEIHIHCQPGGYHVESAQDDVFAGALGTFAVFSHLSNPPP